MHDHDLSRQFLPEHMLFALTYSQLHVQHAHTKDRLNDKVLVEAYILFAWSMCIDFASAASAACVFKPFASVQCFCCCCIVSMFNASASVVPSSCGSAACQSNQPNKLGSVLELLASTQLLHDERAAGKHTAVA